MGTSSLFSCMDYQQRVHNECPKSHENLKKNLDKFGTKRKEFGILKLYLIEFEIQTNSYFVLIHNHIPCKREREESFGHVWRPGREGFITQNKREWAWDKREWAWGVKVAQGGILVLLGFNLWLVQIWFLKPNQTKIKSI